jgi:hypothetical protein
MRTQVFDVLQSTLGLSRQALFLGYLAVPAFIFLTAPLLWPMQK